MDSYGRCDGAIRTKMETIGLDVLTKFSLLLFFVLAQLPYLPPLLIVACDTVRQNSLGKSISSKISIVIMLNQASTLVE